MDTPESELMLAILKYRRDRGELLPECLKLSLTYLDQRLSTPAASSAQPS